MDLYLINGQDGISLPEMIDWDIKLSDSDLSEEVGVNNYLGLGYDLPSLDIEDEPHPLLAYSANSNSSFELDLLGEGGSSTLMVNPSSIMPFVTSRRDHINDSEEDTQIPKSETSEAETQIKIDKIWSNEEEIKVEIIEEEEEEGEENEDNVEHKIDVEELCKEEVQDSSPEPQEIVAVPVEFVNVSMTGNYIEVTPSKKLPIHKRQVIPAADPCVMSGAVKSYPKPAYSYSCLIAMALKNSQTGSLPVSEIYSFMCHHFPYFKTAPNGWKNSVRHNLSLNKCFEKIEKPQGSGSSGSQRKGCLWALNPDKIIKMDEEVAKWSRKDPSAIKKAMVYPDNLEMLERGELVFDAPCDEEIEEDTEEVKEEEEELEDECGVDTEDDRISPIDDDSDDEISRVPPSLQPFEPKFARFSKDKILAKHTDLSFSTNLDLEVADNIYDELEMSDTRTLLGLDDSTPIYAVDPGDENMLIELPLVKRPRVQANYIYQPVLNMKRHNIQGFRSIKIQSP